MEKTAAQSQTLTYLMRRFEEAGIHPKTKHGQNFLIDQNLLRLLADSAEIEPNDVVLEVGTGTGSLTALLAKKAAVVITVEIDQQLISLAGEALMHFPNIIHLHTDVLENKNRLSALVMETVRKELNAAPGRRFKLAANLPYNIATPLVTNLLAGEPLPYSMTITIQKELADRMVARPGTKPYGSLSIWVQSQCRVRIVRVMPPTVFWPRPKVDSAIVQLQIDPELRGRIHDLKFFHHFARSIFIHRRKYLRSQLYNAYKEELEKTDIDEILAERDLSPELRAERLTVEEMLALSEAVQKKIAQRQP